MTDFLTWWADHWPLVPVLVLLGTRIDFYRHAYGWSLDVRVLIFDFGYSVNRRREP